MLSIFLILNPGTASIKIKNKMNKKSFRINSKTTLHIAASNNQSDLDQPLYAINWFNTKSKRLYNLYGVLAFPHVKKVGGEVVFKGKINKTLSGDNSLIRESLLIVKYPSADSFLGLFSQKLFLLKSLLRVKAVKDFVFGFVKMTEGTARSTQKPEKYNGDKSYLVHILKGHFKEDLLNTDYPEGINLFFNGQKAAYIGRSSDDAEIKKGPFFIDRILIWEGEDKDELKSWFKTTEFPIKQTNNIDQGIYLIDRLL